MATTVPSCWDDCKNKEDRDAFLKDLRKSSSKGKNISFQEFLLRQYKKELRGI